MSRANSADTNVSGQSRSRRLFPGRIATSLIVLCLVVMLLVRTFRDEVARVIKIFDTAAVNISTQVLIFVICVIVAVWFLCISDYVWKTKAKVLAALALLLVALASSFRPYGPTGDMVFALAPRPWLAKLLPADRPPPPKQSDAVADLLPTSAHDFPRFLGPAGDNYLPSAGGKALSRDWQTTPPKLRWKQTIGQGWSGFAVVNGFAVTLEQHGEEEWVTCYEVATGRLVWKAVNHGRHEAPMGGVGPRSTPTIHNGRVYTIGGMGLLQCLDGRDGSLIWKDDVLTQCGTNPAREKNAVMWGRSGSPLVVADLGLLVVPGGGPDGAATSLLAYDLASGAVRWRGGTSQISYVSPLEATIAGRRQIISVNEKDVTGHDIETGQVLWKHPWDGSSSGNASCSQPHVLPGDRILLTKGYGEGAEMIRIVDDGEKLTTETVWKNRRAMKTKFTNLTIIGGHAYGLSDGIFECLELERGKTKWRKGRYGHGQVLGVDDLLLVLGEGGQLALLEANPKKLVELGEIDALQGKTWNSFALYGNLLLVRNAEQAACYELPLAP